MVIQVGQENDLVLCSGGDRAPVHQLDLIAGRDPTAFRKYVHTRCEFHVGIGGRDLLAPLIQPDFDRLPGSVMRPGVHSHRAGVRRGQRNLRV